ncbi:MAG: vWA domain-containing protein [Planctomycetales bacterium]
MDAYRLANPLWLLLLPVALGCLAWSARPSRKRGALFSSVAGLRALPATLAQRVRRWLPGLTGLGLCLVVVGLARPQSGRSATRISGEGIAIEIVLDISGSMEALDFHLEEKNVSRLEAVKEVIGRFVLGSRASGLPGRPDDLIGLVAFGGFADGKCPLTLDHGALVDIVQGLEVPKPVRDRQGRLINGDSLKEELATAIGDGVALGVERLRHSLAKSRVIVLLTDGDNNAGAVDPREAAHIAQEAGIKIYAIGIGTSGRVPIPQEDEFGNRVLVAAEFRIDEALLRELAQVTGGEYFHASNTEGLAEVYARIDALEKSEFEETQYAEYTELYPWFAGPGLGMILIVGLLRQTRFRGLP